LLLPDVNVVLAAFRPDHVHYAPAPLFSIRPAARQAIAAGAT